MPGFKWAAAILVGLWPVIGAAQESRTSVLEEIPIEHCDRLLVVKVRVGTADMRFLVDSGATTLLNISSFRNGTVGNVKINSWTGPIGTSAREVQIPVLSLGSHEVRNLKLPAVDLSPIGLACGGQIDGLFGVDLMEAMGMRIDFERKLASFHPKPEDARLLYEEMEPAMHRCVVAFQKGDAKVFEDCLDPQIVLYTSQGEFRGREQVLRYLQDRYFRFVPNLTYNTTLDETRIFGDTLWYSYDYEIKIPTESFTGHAVAMCRKSQGTWRILTLHYSRRDASETNQAR